MSAPRQIHIETVRRLAVRAQLLNGTDEDLLTLIRALGCLQLDPTSIVARSHQLVLWSRLGAYDSADFDRLLWQERRLFEYWAHAASIVLTDHFPIHAAYMQSVQQGESNWHRHMIGWLKENDPLRQHVLESLRTRGPLDLKSIEGEERVSTPWNSSGWTSGRTVAKMVDYLWTRGDLMVYGRKGQSRLWHLSEAVLPDWTPREMLSGHALTRQSVEISLRALGVATATQIRAHFVRGRYPDLPAVLVEMTRDGALIPVQVVSNEGTLPGVWYAHRDDLPAIERLEAGEWAPRTTLLSPFDNLICDRKRTEQLWKFYFRLEIYTPKDKRQYGFYVLPVLHGESLIGRIDPQMDRKNKTLIVNAVHWENNAPQDQSTRSAVRGAVENLASWLGARSIDWRNPSGERLE